MLSFFKNFKYDCCECGKTYMRKHLINYGGNLYCSEKCMSNSFEKMSTIELLELSSVDKSINS